MINNLTIMQLTIVSSKSDAHHVASETILADIESLKHIERAINEGDKKALKYYDYRVIKDTAKWASRAATLSAPVELDEMREALTEVIGFCSCGGIGFIVPLYSVLASINNEHLRPGDTNVGHKLEIDNPEVYYTVEKHSNPVDGTFNLFTDIGAYIVKSVGTFKVGLLEHGGSDNCSWLTEEGAAYLTLLERYVIKANLLSKKAMGRALVRKI